MKKRLWLVLVLMLFAVAAISACKTHSGSREFIPSKGGWVPN